MTAVTLAAKVKYAAGAYGCTIHKARGSSTMDAETAVRRAAERYIECGQLLVAAVRRTAGPDDQGRELWEVTLEMPA